MIYQIGSEKTVLELLKSQTDIKIENKKNQTPRDVAIEQGHSKIADLLIKAKKSAQSGKSFCETENKELYTRKNGNCF